jgi:hypothetical protein
MLPRRIANYLKDRNWTAVGIELLVVVIGVFLGLQVDNWNESRIERNNVKVYYVRLIEDIRNNENSLLAHQAYYQNVRSHGEAALAAMQRPQENLGEQFLIDLYQTTQIWLTVFNRAAYDEILSIGAMSTIPDVDARSRLANYYVAVDAVGSQLHESSAYREIVRARMPIEVQRRIETSCGDTVTVASNGELITRFPENCTLGLSRSTTQGAIESLLGSPMLATQLNRRLSDLDTKLRIMNRNMERSRDLSDYLETSGEPE